MCTRYLLFERDLDEILKRLGFADSAEFFTRFNIAPSSWLPAVRAKAGTPSRESVKLRWGLVPSWVKEDVGFKMVNARVETIAEKPAFRDALKKRRCVIPASGFYEWKTAGKIKQPMLVRRRDERPFCFAGLWEAWRAPAGQPLESCTIVTTEPNELMRTIHNRMPFMLTPEQCEPWLDASVTDGPKILALLQPQSAESMSATPVSRYVSNVRHEGPECLAPAPPEDVAGDEPQLSLGFE